MSRLPSAEAPDHIAYLDAAAASPPGRDYKRRALALLDPRPGQVVVDIGCGPGTDLGALADAVGPQGRVIGVDVDPAMLAEARRRLANRPTVELCPGDGHALPLATASADRARMDRVLQHVADPARVLGEAYRILRPGGVATMAEPDWDTLAVDDVDLATSRAFTRHVAGLVRNPVVGRQLARLATGAGFTVQNVEPNVVLLRDFTAAEELLGLRRNATRAVRAGLLAEDAAGAWLDRLAETPFLASFTFLVVTARR